MMQFAQRLQALQSNVFADMDRTKTQAKLAGKTIIDLSLGSSDLPTDKTILAEIARSLNDPTTHGYLLHNGTQAFRTAVAQWYSERYGISVNPETEVLPLIGSQEGTAHFPLAILNPGDFALLLDPGYPSHAGGVYLAGGQIYPMPLLAENEFLPIFADIPQAILDQSKLMVLSYPHNPTTAIAPLSFFEEAVKFCRKNQLVLVHDFPYFDFVFGETPLPPSVLQADRQKELSIEFFTFSKSHNMGGFRVGFAIGNAELILNLRKIKAMIDFNQYQGILNGAIAALKSPPSLIQETINHFEIRRDAFVQALSKIGWQVPTPSATMYVWAKLPEPWQKDSIKFCTELVLSTGIAVSPGAGFGKTGEGYVRFALVYEPDILEKAVQKISEFLSEDHNH